MDLTNRTHNCRSLGDNLFDISTRHDRLKTKIAVLNNIVNFIMSRISVSVRSKEWNGRMKCGISTRFSLMGFVSGRHVAIIGSKRLIAITLR